MDGYRIGWLIAGTNQMVWVGVPVQEVPVGTLFQDLIRMKLVEESGQTRR